MTVVKSKRKKYIVTFIVWNVFVMVMLTNTVENYFIKGLGDALFTLFLPGVWLASVLFGSIHSMGILGIILGVLMQNIFLFALLYGFYCFLQKLKAN